MNACGRSPLRPCWPLRPKECYLREGHYSCTYLPPLVSHRPSWYREVRRPTGVDLPDQHRGSAPKQTAARVLGLWIPAKGDGCCSVLFFFFLFIFFARRVVLFFLRSLKKHFRRLRILIFVLCSFFVLLSRQNYLIFFFPKNTPRLLYI